ncbi:IS3 family transposase [Streptomyces sp. TRM68367]|nr:IS3 family transposase [Streptomyces sp. TRM68367]
MFGLEPVLRELHIASSTYYRWRRAEKEPCERRRQDAELTEKIQRIHADSGGTYGSPRVHAVLKREGVHVGRKRVERLMREDGLAGISPRRTSFTRRDPKATLAPDLVQRDFTALAPNRLWVTDLTMGSVGDSYDNALAENLWILIKTECVRGRVFETRAEANLALFEYIDGFYNSRRIQARLGWLSPIEFEEKYYTDQASAEQANLKPRQPALTS